MTLLKRIIRTAITLVSLSILIITVLSISEGINAFQVHESKITSFYGDYSQNPIYSPLIRLNGANGFFCSASVIDKHYALTAGHCVTGLFGRMKDEQIDVANEEGIFVGIKAEAVAVDLYRDVALLKGDFSDFKNAKVDFGSADTQVIMNKLAVACGFPGGGAQFCTEMILTGNNAFKIVGVGGVIQKGMSGGPLIDLSTGAIIGVNSAAGSDYNVFGPLMGVDAIFGIRGPK